MSSCYSAVCLLIDWLGGWLAMGFGHCMTAIFKRTYLSSFHSKSYTGHCTCLVCGALRWRHDCSPWIVHLLWGLATIVLEVYPPYVNPCKASQHRNPISIFYKALSGMQSLHFTTSWSWSKKAYGWGMEVLWKRISQEYHFGRNKVTQCDDVYFTKFQQKFFTIMQLIDEILHFLINSRI